MKKTLICYFSASGVTKSVATNLSQIMNADLFVIEPLIKYTNEDLDWNDKNSRSSKEMEDATSRPEMKEQLNNINDYDTILIGYPIWWDLAPRIINTFMESVNLENKKVYVFATSGGSGVENSFQMLRKEYPNINFISAKRLSWNATKDEILSWLEG